ncbi:uncharacterized protein LOC130623290 [Hydractinia symbiolongicarpus]|uniref:uncharacterized protein LOC130623290 n=1 Tax=Hydractinia symbiolongicarpus TaxID=13093 RepID=UPI002550ADF3|nr:uncharacterized protein LOC130623290 [Hydractinia symbiolongicarpus]
MDNVIMNIDRDTLSDIYKNQCIGQHLSKIMNGERENWRHKVFFNIKREESEIGRTHLSQYFDCGALNDDQIETLCHLTANDVNIPQCSLDYRTKVFLPECFVQVYINVFGCGRQESEVYLDEGGITDYVKVFKLKAKSVEAKKNMENFSLHKDGQEVDSRKIHSNCSMQIGKVAHKYYDSRKFIPVFRCLMFF